MLTLLLSLQLATAADRYVGPDEQYADIKAALAAAQNGDTVIIGPGQHDLGGAAFPSGIVVLGAGESSVLLRPAQSSAVVRVTTGSLTLRNLVIDGQGERRVVAMVGSQTSLTLERVRVSGGVSVDGTEGKLIRVESGNFVARESYLEGGATGGVEARGGILAALEGSVTLTDSKLTGGRASAGGAIYATGGAYVSLRDTAVTDNEATNQGGAVRVDNATFDARSSWIQNCKSPAGACLYGGTLARIQLYDVDVTEAAGSPAIEAPSLRNLVIDQSRFIGNVGIKVKKNPTQSEQVNISRSMFCGDPTERQIQIDGFGQPNFAWNLVVDWPATPTVGAPPMIEVIGNNSGRLVHNAVVGNPSAPRRLIDLSGGSSASFYSNFLGSGSGSGITFGQYPQGRGNVVFGIEEDTLVSAQGPVPAYTVGDPRFAAWPPAADATTDEVCRWETFGYAPDSALVGQGSRGYINTYPGGRYAQFDVDPSWIGFTSYPPNQSEDWLLNPDGSAIDAGPFGGHLVDESWWVDEDGDGQPVVNDCDDFDPASWIGASERCDGVDNDGDGEIDEDQATLWFFDGDGDGWGASNLTWDGCDAPLGFVTLAGDCDDSDPSVHPGAVDRCGGGDDDCDGSTDEDEASRSWYGDSDGDGWGDASEAQSACAQPPGTVANPNDCDPLDEVIGPTTFYADADYDGSGRDDVTRYGCGSSLSVNYSNWSKASGDCDDQQGANRPGNTESCDGVDNDCDDEVDEGQNLRAFQEDLDLDGVGAGTSTLLCAWPGGTPLGVASRETTAASDCADTDPFQRPGRFEECDGDDENCNGLVDDQPRLGGSSWLPDVDDDGYYAMGMGTTFCDDPGPGWTSSSSGMDCDDNNPAVGGYGNLYNDIDKDGYGGQYVGGGCPTGGQVAVGNDCDDNNAARFPGAKESCNGFDDDCDYSTDEAGGTFKFFRDQDGDGWGGDETSLACNNFPPSGFSAQTGDCDDKDGNVSPGRSDNDCNGKDNDCDKEVDEDNLLTRYPDQDSDGYGDEDAEPKVFDTCKDTVPPNLASSNDDCDDKNKDVRPWATETCNGVDDNCDGDVDNGVMGAPWYYPDNDKDGFADTSAGITACSDPGPPWIQGGQTDCDDDDPETLGYITLYPDGDKDGFGDNNTSTSGCLKDNPGYLAKAGDCDDKNPNRRPGATETCNTYDDDCDGATDEAGGTYPMYIDADSDGWGSDLIELSCVTYAQVYQQTVNGDCDDDDKERNPGRYDGDCNGIDDNCDGVADDQQKSTWYADQDGDGYGAGDAIEINSCENGDTSGLAKSNNDCDDSDAYRYPNGSEICDGFDDNCNGVIDDYATGATEWRPDNDGDQCTEPVFKDGPGGKEYNLNAEAQWFCSYPGTGWTTEWCLDCDDEDPETAALLYGPDGDNDGIGSDNNWIELCEDPGDGYALLGETNANNWDVAWYNRDCNDSDPSIGAAVPVYLDLDQDGFGRLQVDAACPGDGMEFPFGTLEAGDCNDANPAIRPGVIEFCDLIDNNCDEAIDEGYDVVPWYRDQDGDGFGGEYLYDGCPIQGFVAGQTQLPGDCDDTKQSVKGTRYYVDADQDGHGDPSLFTAACGAGPEGYVPLSDDCDDEDSNQYPGNYEACDGIDQNCNDVVDDGLPLQTWFMDADLDGFGDPSSAVLSCADPGEHVQNASDCNDASALVNPIAVDDCLTPADEDCSGANLPCTGIDKDGDGFCQAASCSDGAKPGDCDDDNEARSPYAVEVCDGVDQDCDGVIDDGLTQDEDNDGYTSASSCGGSRNDCNDLIANVFPGADEACNGLDDDCDGIADENLWVDLDGDGWPVQSDCVTAAFADCQPGDPEAYPGAAEVVGNEADDDCDGQVDEDDSAFDNDGDGYCESTSACADDGIDNDGDETIDEPGEVLPGDCDDNDASQNPGQAEVLNNKDDNCDGTDDNLPAVDADLDGVTLQDGDCNDFDAQIHPASGSVAAAAERCNGIDDDCDGFVPAAERDNDGDGWRGCAAEEGGLFDCNDNDNRSRPYLAENCTDGIDNDCDGSIDVDADLDGDGVTTCSGDCVDSNPEVKPGALEACNLLDDDCDGKADEGFDLDGDGVVACSQCTPDPLTCDCDDTNALVRPGLPERCGDGVDNDCICGSPVDPEGEDDGDPTDDIWQICEPGMKDFDAATDADGDGYSSCQEDCNDVNFFVNPGMVEVCNLVDDDCNRYVDDGLDIDGDGQACADDCSEQDPLRYVGAPEECDGLDNNCNQTIDDEFADDDGDGLSECVGDCDDEDSGRSPSFQEVCGNQIDDDCDDLVDWDDDDCDPGVAPAYWFCASADGGGLGWIGIIAGLALLRRRRAA